MTEPTELTIHADYAPRLHEILQVLKMCEDHDLPLEKLPGLWDEHQQLQKVERRAGIQNGNMDREIKRLRSLTGELDAQVRDEQLRSAALEANNCVLKGRLDELADLSDKYEALLLRCKHFEALADSKRIEHLEDFVAHYRCGMAGMKEIANNKHFSNELRVYLLRKCLYTFEPELKEEADA